MYVKRQPNMYHLQEEKERVQSVWLLNLVSEICSGQVWLIVKKVTCHALCFSIPAFKNFSLLLSHMCSLASFNSDSHWLESVVCLSLFFRLLLSLFLSLFVSLFLSASLSLSCPRLGIAYAETKVLSLRIRSCQKFYLLRSATGNFALLTGR